MPPVSKMELNSCHCGKESTKLQTKKSGPNFNRFFYACSARKCNYFKWIGKRCVDSSLYVTRMEKIKRRQGNYTLEGSGVIEAIRDRYTSVKFYVHSIDNIAITLGDNSHSLLSCVRHLPGITFDESNQEWILPATYALYVQAYESLLRSPFYRYIKCTPLTDNAIRFLERNSCRSVDPRESLKDPVEERISTHVLPYSIWSHMMDYQQQGVRQCLTKGGRVLLADDMGLGKTIQALAVALAYSESWPVLVICPTSLLFTWSDQIQQWLHSIVSNQDIRLTLNGTSLFGFTPNQVLPVLTDTSPSLVWSDYDNPALDQLLSQPHQNVPLAPHLMDGSQKRTPFFNIISYNMATTNCDTLLGMDFKFIICDESHSLKNPKTKRTMTLTPLLHQAKYVLLLTGTPILSRPIELHPQLFILQKDLFPDINAFGLQYCNGRKGKYGWDFTGSSNLVELNFILQRSVMIRRLKTHVHISLPSKVRQRVMMTIDPVQKQRLSDIKNDLSELHLRCPAADADKKAQTMKLYKATGTAKISSIVSYLQQLLSTTTNQVLIFAFHKDVMNAIEKLTNDLKVTSIRIDGTTKQTHRNTLCRQFQEGARVALLSITAGQVGLNLQAATTVVFAELYWNPAHILQAEDRAHRIGQTNTVNVKYLLAADTTDDLLWLMINEKFKVMHQLLD